MHRRFCVYEGTTKIVFRSQDYKFYIQFFKDIIFNKKKQKKEFFKGKGVLKNLISKYIFINLKNIGIPTYFIKSINMSEQLIYAIDRIPLKILIRNIAIGSFAKKFNLISGDFLPCAIIEFYYKKKDIKSYMVSEEHITSFGWANTQEIEEIITLSIRINDFLSGLLLGIKMRLIDFKIEFGRLILEDTVQIVLSNEISPDSFRIIDIIKNDNKKDFFDIRPINIMNIYKNLAYRFGIIKKNKDFKKQYELLDNNKKIIKLYN